MRPRELFTQLYHTPAPGVQWQASGGEGVGLWDLVQPARAYLPTSLVVPLTASQVIPYSIRLNELKVANGDQANKQV